MIGFLRKNNNNAVAALVNNSANNAGPNATAGNNSLAQKAHVDSSSESDASQDVTIQDIKARYSNRQQREGSASDREQLVVAQKVPGLSLLKMGGIGGLGKAPMSHRAHKKAATYRSRNDTIGSKLMAAQSHDIQKPADDNKLAANMPASLFTSQRNSALEGGNAEIGGMTSFNNTRGTFRKKMSGLNNDGLSMRERQDLRDQLQNVKEVIDPNRSGAIFDIKDSAQYQGDQLSTTDYIPKKPVMEHLKRVEMRHNEKVQLYKQYTLDLKEKYHKFEVESQRHYANIIKKHQQQTDDIINNKEALLQQMKESKEQSLDELNLLRAKLYKARAEGKLEKVLDEEQEDDKDKEEQKLIAAEQNEELDLDRPVDVKAFEALKIYRNKLKSENIEWINKFKRAHKRDPTDQDLDEVREQIEDYNTTNNKYILMKAKMIRQGVIPLNLVTKAKNAEQPVPVAGVAKVMNRTGFKFDARSDSPAPNAFLSTKGFQDAFLGDPSIKKLKDDIQQKEKQNVELEDEIQRLRYNLMDKVGDNDVVIGLQREVEIKEDQMKERDEEIKTLIDEKAAIENEKNTLRKEIEQLKVKQLLDKNVGLLVRQSTKSVPTLDGLQRSAVDSQKEQELVELQEQNEKLKGQVVALQQLQRKTVYGGSFLETKQEMSENTRQAMSKSAVGAEPELKKEKSSESIIASFLQRNESLVKSDAPEQPTAEAAETAEERATTPHLEVAEKLEEAEGAPEVVEIPDAERSAAQESATEPEPVVREVVEAGTNMTISANEAALELQRINEQILEQTREDLAAKEAKIKQMGEQMTMLEHALADKEQDLVEQDAQHSDRRSEDEAQWEKTRKDMQEHIEELGTAIREKVAALEELEAQKQALQDGYEMRLAEKEAEVEAAIKEHEAIQTALKKDIHDLQAVVKDQKAQGDLQSKQHDETLAQREQALRAEADLRIKEKEDEIQQLKEELTFNGKDMQDRIAEISQLQVELANQKEEEEKLLKKIEHLQEEAGNAQELAEQLKVLSGEKEELQRENEAKQQVLDGVAEKFKEEQVKRKHLLNELEDMKGKIRVYCRVRPFSRTEAEDETRRRMCVDINDEMSLTVRGRFDNHYNFDSVFGPDSTQDQVFDETKRLIQSAVDGYNVCVFAYGQTGSGKTFTIQGDHANPGLTPRSIHELYQIIGGMHQFDVELSCYMVEIYKGQLRDLLLPKNTRDRPNLEVRMNQTGQVQVKNVVVQPLNTEEDTTRVFETGLGGRQVRKTLMNDESSRSHLIFSIIIDATNKLTGKKTSGKLSFIDLAGSESSKKTGTDKEGQAEANAINQSLSALGNVISALAEGAKFIRYKENLLTKLMQDSLGGNAKTLMFVNCSPSVYNEMETKNSLEYAKRVKEIKNNPTLNLETKAMQMAHRQIEAQRTVIDSLKGLAQDNGLADKLAEVLAQYEKNDEQNEGGSVFSLNLDAIKEHSEDNQIKEKPHSGRDSIAPRKSVLQQDSSRSNESSGRLSMRPSLSGPIKQFKK